MRERLWLVGMMGSGKSTVGRGVADAAGLGFIDTDTLIEDRAGMSIPELFETVGVVAFRDLEKQAIETASEFRGVIATGGGTVLDPSSRQTMADSGLVVYLSADPATLADRIGDTTGRPLLHEQDPTVTLERILDEREPLYRQVADHVFPTDGTQSDIVQEVMRAWTDS